MELERFTSVLGKDKENDVKAHASQGGDARQPAWLHKGKSCLTNLL